MNILCESRVVICQWNDMFEMKSREKILKGYKSDGIKNWWQRENVSRKRL